MGITGYEEEYYANIRAIRKAQESQAKALIEIVEILRSFNGKWT